VLIFSLVFFVAPTPGNLSADAHVCGHTINFEDSYDFCTKKCRHSNLKNPFSLVRKMVQTNPP